MINGIFLLLGSNKGDRKSNFEKAKTLMFQEDTQLIRSSSCYLSPPWGPVEQPYFLNQVLQIQTSLDPNQLLDRCLDVEGLMGRIRKERYGPRVIDIDILYYNQEVIHSNNLILPHPRLHLRTFTLKPMVELAADFIHPLLKATQHELLKSSPDSLPVRKLPG
jgi:2-amino-4-hydroxy-6-hydroxymethyldihydropteridine diphosphokinase